MRHPGDWFGELDGDWRAAVVGALAAPVLVVTGIGVGAIEGGLLPQDCQGLACIYLAIVLLYAGGLLAVWAAVSGIVALSRRRWPGSPVRLRILQVLAALSYGPAIWLVVTAIGEGR